jgi:hypothetical protein
MEVTKRVRKTKKQLKQSCDALRKVLAFITMSYISKDFDICISSVSLWRVKGVPSSRAERLSELTNGLVSKYDLAPELLELEQNEE